MGKCQGVNFLYEGFVTLRTEDTQVFGESVHKINTQCMKLVAKQEIPDES